MREVLLIAAILALLAAVAVAANLSFEVSALLSIGLVGAGFGVGIPTALIYHGKLYGGLKEQGHIPKRWYWKPVSLHDDIGDDAYRRMLPWFVTAAGGFALVVLGIVMIVTTMVSGLMR